MNYNEAKMTPVAEFTKPVLTNRNSLLDACLDVLKVNPAKKYNISELYYMAIQAGLRPRAQFTLYNTAASLRKLCLAQLKHNISTFSWIPNQNTADENDSAYNDASDDDSINYDNAYGDIYDADDDDSDQELLDDENSISSRSLDLVTEIASLEASIVQHNQQLQKLQVSIADKKAQMEQANANVPLVIINC